MSCFSASGAALLSLMHAWVQGTGHKNSRDDREEVRQDTAPTAVWSTVCARGAVGKADLCWMRADEQVIITEMSATT